jgi:hypothetical protein
MAVDTAPLTLRVQRLDRDRDLTIDLGTVTIGPQGHLTVAAAEAPFKEYLAGVVETVNAQKEIHIKVPPPADGRPNGIYYLLVARTSPDLLEMMRQYLEEKYDLLLMS